MALPVDPARNQWYVAAYGREVGRDLLGRTACGEPIVLYRTGTPEVASTPISTEVDEDNGVVRVSRRMTDAQCPPFYARSTGITGRIDRRQDIEYHPPCLYLLHARIAPTGVQPGPDGDDSQALHVAARTSRGPRRDRPDRPGGRRCAGPAGAGVR
jgi:hypothetical protein